MGFLYIRYVANPRTIWGWIQPYVRDEEVSAAQDACCCDDIS